MRPLGIIVLLAIIGTVDLDVRTPAGEQSTIAVDRERFQAEGFKAVPKETCPPPVEKISKNCVKCKNDTIVCSPPR